MWRDYRDQRFQVLALDFWNGSDDWVRHFQEFTGATFPILKNARPLRAVYGLKEQHYVVVGPDGIVRYTTQHVLRNNLGHWNDAEVRAAIDAWLPTTAVNQKTWSGVRALYR